MFTFLWKHCQSISFSNSIIVGRICKLNKQKSKIKYKCVNYQMLAIYTFLFKYKLTYKKTLPIYKHFLNLVLLLNAFNIT